MKKDKRSKHHSTDEGGYVYSTGGNTALADLLAKMQPETTDGPTGNTTLEVWLEKKGRGGKTAVVIKGFPGTDAEGEDLAKHLKSKLGTGGSYKDGEIIVQGHQRDKVMELLHDRGFKTKRIGG